jgi:C4-type Zn-finger protein
MKTNKTLPEMREERREMIIHCPRCDGAMTKGQGRETINHHRKRVWFCEKCNRTRYYGK